MNYRIRKGVILTRVCDESVLVATHEAQQYCPFTTILNETGEFIYASLKEGNDIKQISAKLKENYEIPGDINVPGLVKEYIALLHEKGYVLYEEEN